MQIYSYSHTLYRVCCSKLPIHETLFVRYGTYTLQPGTKVINKPAKSLGAVISTVETQDELRYLKNHASYKDKYKDIECITPKIVKVAWLSGPKKGKTSDHATHEILDYESYLGAIKRKYDELEALDPKQGDVA